MTGDELRARREKLGLSQTRLARLLGTTQNTISRWELGEMQIEKSEMRNLALLALEHGAKKPKRKGG